MIDKWFRRSVALDEEGRHRWLDFMLVLMKLKLVEYYNVENEYNVKLVSGIESSNIIVNNKRFDSDW